MDKELDERTENYEGKIPAKWRVPEGRVALERKFRFDDFPSTWGFLTRVALLSQNRNHYPELTTTFNRVKITITSSPESSEITEDDRQLAEAINRLL